ncbi:MAG: type II secretion system protein GspG [Blastocatellia bacterium]
MMCPCCGDDIRIEAEACPCGARFVGVPLDETPARIRHYGPAMTALLLLALAIALTAILTKWLAPLALVPAWLAMRAWRLEKRDPADYGGRRVAMVTLGLALVGMIGMATYGVSRVPRALENYRVRRVAATEAAMHHVAAILEDYKLTTGSYPKNTDDLKKVLSEAMPGDYWEKAIRYQSYPEALARNDDPRALGKAPIQYNTFELRSAGADGIEGTDDDIIMRDGVFFTNAEIKKLPAVRTSSDR